MDAVDEFKTLTSNAPGDFGIGSAGTINMSIKSGTRDFHGAVWEFFRNNDMDANNYFANLAGTAPPELRYNIFGFNIGGPLVIPKLYNKRSQEDILLLEPNTNDPVQNARFAAAGLMPGQAFPANKIPASLIDPNAALFFSSGAMPLPNAPNNFFSGSKAAPPMCPRRSCVSITT
ncbi:MAG TPA: hypothetical protein VMG35_19290 [Bryobacteraceae bacterium]|nr:hypothetical protein [Bryobacteraceae bacterium]